MRRLPPGALRDSLELVRISPGERIAGVQRFTRPTSRSLPSNPFPPMRPPGILTAEAGDCAITRRAIPSEQRPDLPDADRTSGRSGRRPLSERRLKASGSRVYPRRPYTRGGTRCSFALSPWPIPEERPTDAGAAGMPGHRDRRQKRTAAGRPTLRTQAAWFVVLPRRPEQTAWPQRDEPASWAPGGRACAAWPCARIRWQ